MAPRCAEKWKECYPLNKRPTCCALWSLEKNWWKFRQPALNEKHAVQSSMIRPPAVPSDNWRSASHRLPWSSWWNRSTHAPSVGAPSHYFGNFNVNYVFPWKSTLKVDFYIFKIYFKFFKIYFKFFKIYFKFFKIYFNFFRIYFNFLKNYFKIFKN